MKSYWNKRKVVITGASGFIGSSIIPKLFDKQAEITAAVYSSEDNAILAERLGVLIEKIRIKSCDLTDLKDCTSLLDKQDVVFNFAGIDGGIKFKTENSANILRTNLLITSNVLESARINNLERVLLMSSIDVYSNEKCKIYHKETDELNIRVGNGYAWSKRICEILAFQYYKQYGLKVAIGRCGNIFGPYDNIDPSRMRVLTSFIIKALKNEDIEVFGDLRYKRAYLYIDDLIDILLSLVENCSDATPYNVVGTNYVSLKEVVEMIKSVTRSRSKVFLTDKKKTEKIRLPVCTYSVDKIKSKIGFIERTDLKTGIRKTIKYLKKYLML